MPPALGSLTFLLEGPSERSFDGCRLLGRLVCRVGRDGCLPSPPCLASQPFECPVGFACSELVGAGDVAAAVRWEQGTLPPSVLNGDDMVGLPRIVVALAVTTYPAGGCGGTDPPPLLSKSAPVSRPTSPPVSTDGCFTVSDAVEAGGASWAA